MIAMLADTDIAIVGGGPVGAALALALRHSAHRITVLEARAERKREPRPIALSYGSRLLLERLGVWHTMSRTAPTPISNIHISQRGGFGRVAISAADAEVPALGYVFDYNEIFFDLSEAARAACSDYRVGAHATAVHRDGDAQRIDYTRNGVAESLCARIVVIADGSPLDGDGLAPLKTIDYDQHALTARVGTTLPHNHVAYERFTHEGPLALLPFGKDMSLVWTLPAARAAELLQADPDTFLAALRETFGARLGEFTSVEQRACFPLVLRYTANASTPGVMSIGNAAQTLHPVAGQGFNLGLRDAWELAQRVVSILPRDLNDQSLRQYRASRRIDRGASVATTHALVRLFSNDFMPLQVARGAGMTLLGCIAPARNFLARRMIYGARG